MLRGLILLLLVLLVAFLALPFVMTSRALEEHGITIPGRVYHKSESVRVIYSGWELSRDITIEYTVPETSSVGFFAVTVFTTNEGTPRRKFEWFLCLISKSRTVTGV